MIARTRGHMMTWKTRNRSFYYEGAPEPDDLDLKPAETALLVIDVQNTYVERPDRANVVVVEDCCAVGTDALHEKELAIINMIYCHVMNTAELIG